MVWKLKLDKNGKKYKGGRKRDRDVAGSLGLVLIWYRMRGACTRNLALRFGLTCTPMYGWLKFGCRVLLSILLNADGVKVTLLI